MFWLHSFYSRVYGQTYYFYFYPVNIKPLCPIPANPAGCRVSAALPRFGAAFSPLDLQSFPNCCLPPVCCHCGLAFARFSWAFVLACCKVYLREQLLFLLPDPACILYSHVAPLSLFMPHSDMTITSKPVAFSTFLLILLFPSSTHNGVKSVFQGSA